MEIRPDQRDKLLHRMKVASEIDVLRAPTYHGVGSYDSLHPFRWLLVEGLSHVESDHTLWRSPSELLPRAPRMAASVEV